MATRPPIQVGRNSTSQAQLRQKHLLPSDEVCGPPGLVRRKTRPRSELIKKDLSFGSCGDIRISDATEKLRRRRTSLFKMFKSEVNLIKTESLSDLSERGVPEGQEDPAMHTSFCSSVLTVPVRKLRYRPNRDELKVWVREKLKSRTPEWFPVYVEGSQYEWKGDNVDLVLPKKSNPSKHLCRINFEDGEVVKKCWNLLQFDSEDECHPTTLCLSNLALYTLTPDGHVVTKVKFSEICSIEISCNYTRIDIITGGLLSLLVPDQELCLTVISFLEHARRNMKQLEIKVSPPNYAPLNNALFDCFILRDVDGGGAFQLDVSAETASGHLMYCRLHKDKNIKWISGYFTLSNLASAPLKIYSLYEGRILQCFSSSNVPHPKWDIPLRETDMMVSLGSSSSLRPNTIELWYQNKTALILAAANSEEAHTWYSKIARTLDALSPVKAHRSMSLQHRILMLDNFGISLLKWQSGVLSRGFVAKLEQIGAIKLDPELDSAFMVIDFEWQEAEDSAGDLVLHFPSWNQMEEFLSQVREFLSPTAEICYFEEGSYLLQRCRNVSEVLNFDFLEE